jgi:hypothetical protein
MCASSILRMTSLPRSKIWVWLFPIGVDDRHFEEIPARQAM